MYFKLYLPTIKVGFLKYSSINKKWYFVYTKLYILSNYNFIIGLPNINKPISSFILWSFFKSRIPSLRQPKVKEILESDKIDKNDTVKLLIRFGEKTINNPYKLKYYEKKKLNYQKTLMY